MFTAPLDSDDRLLFHYSGFHTSCQKFFSLMESESSPTVGPDTLRSKTITKTNYMSSYSVIILSKLRPIIRLHLIVLTRRSMLKFVSVLTL
jgi:hypothetical protein